MKVIITLDSDDIDMDWFKIGLEIDNLVIMADRDMTVGHISKEDVRFERTDLRAIR